MINQVSSTNLLQNYALNPAVVAEQPKTDNAVQPEIAQDIVKKETADAAKAYACIAPPQKEAPEKKSLDELKADLIAQGKVEGKDFKIEKMEDKKGVYGHELTVLENDKPVKIYFYAVGATKDDFQSVEEYSYPIGDGKGLKSTITSYGADGEFHYRTNRYEKENSPYQNEIVNLDTKPFELENKLKEAGIQYARDIEWSCDNENLENRMITKITAFDPKTNEVTRYEFNYDRDNDKVNEVVKNNIDKDGGIKSYIIFRNDETAFVNFEDNKIA